MPSPIEAEVVAFGAALSGLLLNPANAGAFALVAGGQVQGVYPTEDAALDAGYDRFGMGPFLVKRIVAHEEPRYFSRNLVRCP